MGSRKGAHNSGVPAMMGPKEGAENGRASVRGHRNIVPSNIKVQTMSPGTAFYTPLQAWKQIIGCEQVGTLPLDCYARTFSLSFFR
jgi:hypothetical protein